MGLTITLLMDNTDSWIIPYGQSLKQKLIDRGDDCRIIHDTKKIPEGDILVLLGCEEILSEEQLNKNEHNLVIHESDLPRGKGWSPLTWQILDGKNTIPITLFEALPEVDSGPIYAQKTMEFEGHELVDELREVQGRYTIELVMEFIEEYPEVEEKPHEGPETFYPRRTPEDSELDPEQSLIDQFNLLRVVDNERYPAFFHHQGHKYVLKVEKADND
jgi:methionyl-tRNA formyltransferase